MATVCASMGLLRKLDTIANPHPHIHRRLVETNAPYNIDEKYPRSTGRGRSAFRAPR